MMMSRWRENKPKSHTSDKMTDKEKKNVSRFTLVDFSRVRYPEVKNSVNF